MLQNITQLAGLFKKQKINSDSFTMKLCYRFLSTFLVGSAVITITNNYFGVHMQCLTSNAANQRIITANCWSQGTWIYANVEEFEEFRSMIGSVAPGVHGPVKTSKGPEPEKVYNLIYVFIPFIYIGLAISCHIGRYWWRNMQGTTLPQLVRDFKNQTLDEKAEERIVSESAGRFLNDIRQHQPFANLYSLVLVVNLCVLVGQIVLIIVVLADGNWKFGYTALTWVSTPYEDWPIDLARSFPQITKCTMKSFGVGGNIEIADALCFLVMNKVNMINFALHWWILIALIPMSAYELVDHLIKYISVRHRTVELRQVLNVQPESDVGQFVKELDFGSAFVVLLLAKNIPKDILCNILLEIKGEFDTNGFEMNRRINGFL